MKLKMNEIVSLHYELNGITRIENEQQTILLQGLLRQKMSIKLKFYLNRLAKIVEEEIKLFEKQREGITEQNELNELLTAEKEIDVRTLWGSDLSIANFGNIETDEIYPVFLKLLDNEAPN